jgi:hypothetical protein
MKLTDRTVFATTFPSPTPVRREYTTISICYSFYILLDMLVYGVGHPPLSSEKLSAKINLLIRHLNSLPLDSIKL